MHSSFFMSNVVSPTITTQDKPKIELANSGLLFAKIFMKQLKFVSFAESIHNQTKVFIKGLDGH